MARAILIGGGDCNPSLLPKKRDDDLLIAADSGLLVLRQAGREPDLCIGDFDSLGFQPPDALVLPVRKDDTDLMAAARIALARGYRNFVLLGVLGGKRFSHSVAALQTLCFLAEEGAEAEILDEHCRISVLRNATREYDETATGLLSVFAMSGPVRVTLDGLSYPLPPTLLTTSYPLGVSNAFVGKKAKVTADGGTLLLIEEPDAS